MRLEGKGFTVVTFETDDQLAPILLLVCNFLWPIRDVSNESYITAIQAGKAFGVGEGLCL